MSTDPQFFCQYCQQLRRIETRVEVLGCNGQKRFRCHICEQRRIEGMEHSSKQPSDQQSPKEIARRLTLTKPRVNRPIISRKLRDRLEDRELKRQLSDYDFDV